MYFESIFMFPYHNLENGSTDCEFSICLFIVLNIEQFFSRGKKFRKNHEILNILQSYHFFNLYQQDKAEVFTFVNAQILETTGSNRDFFYIVYLSKKATGYTTSPFDKQKSNNIEKCSQQCESGAITCIELHFFQQLVQQCTKGIASFL